MQLADAIGVRSHCQRSELRLGKDRNADIAPMRARGKLALIQGGHAASIVSERDIYRERGVLRRLQTTPIGPVRVLVARLAADLTVAVATVVLILAVARIGFGVPLPRQAGGFVLAALLAAAALLGAGLLVAAIAPTGRVARGIGALLFYVMMFFAGLWLPIPNMPATLQHISHATPLGAAVPALTAATQGSLPTALQLLTMAGWAAAFGLAAARFFRWE